LWWHGVSWIAAVATIVIPAVRGTWVVACAITYVWWRQKPRSLATLGMTGFSEVIVHQERRYFVYIMSNPSKTLYTGITNSIRRRVREHKLKLTPGFAAKYNITRLVYFETFEDVRNAIEREKQIKAWTRAKRVALIETVNPKWDDLSREWDQPQTFRFVPKTA